MGVSILSYCGLPTLGQLCDKKQKTERQHDRGQYFNACKILTSLIDRLGQAPRQVWPQTEASERKPIPCHPPQALYLPRPTNRFQLQQSCPSPSAHEPHKPTTRKRCQEGRGPYRRLMLHSGLDLKDCRKYTKPSSQEGKRRKGHCSSGQSLG